MYYNTIRVDSGGHANTVFKEGKMIHTFCHIEIPVTDFEKAKAFYPGLFGWKVELIPEMNYATFETGAPPGGGFQKVDKVERGGPVNYVLVEDIEATLEKAKELGAGEIIHEKTQVGDMGWFAIFSDPDGNRVGIWQEKK